MIRALAAVLVLASGVARAAEGGPPAAADVSSRSWMQAALDNWQAICGEVLRQPVEPLPWIIFYDERSAWHVAAEDAMLPERAPAGFTLRFNGRERPVWRMPHTAGSLWVPERAPVPVAHARIFTAPYADGAKAFVICALPPLVATTLHRDRPAHFDEFLLGIVSHEIAHTRQVRAADARIKELRETSALPGSFDDNVVEGAFAQHVEYRRLWDEELNKLLTAALQDDQPEMGRRLVGEALALMRERRARFFTGEYRAFAALDDLWLVFEGIGQWAHFQTLRRHAGSAGEPWQKTALEFLEETKSWVQLEGFALLVLIDRHVPNWQEKFFAEELPPPFAVLEQALREQDMPRAEK